MKVKLENILEAIELANDEFEYYINIVTGETIIHSDSLITGITDEETETDLEENFDKYLLLPTKHEINEYEIMEQFIWSLPEDKNQNILENVIHGKGAFRRFKDCVNKMGIEKQWFVYEAKAYRKIAIKWCEKHNLEYEE